jgi:hypothetical protein
MHQKLPIQPDEPNTVPVLTVIGDRYTAKTFAVVAGPPFKCFPVLQTQPCVQAFGNMHSI